MFHMKHIVKSKNDCLFQINLIFRPKMTVSLNKGTFLLLSFIHTSPQLSPVFNRIARNKGLFRTEFDNNPVSFRCAGTGSRTLLVQYPDWSAEKAELNRASPPGRKRLALPCSFLVSTSVRAPGVEPGFLPWQGNVIPLNHARLMKNIIARKRIFTNTDGG